MMKPLLILVLCAIASPVLACNPGLFDRLYSMPATEPDQSLDVSEIQSTEGGEWKIWLDASDKATDIARFDYGEMVRGERHLIVDSADAYAVVVTTYLYSAPIYMANSTTIRQEKDFYLFCDRTLFGQNADWGVDPDYVAKAVEALAVFDASEIAGFVPVLMR